jgi:hypothetical protein
MKAEIKDKDNVIYTAIRAAGYDITAEDTEVLLNIIDLMRESKHEVTLKEIIQLSTMTRELFKP